jgi:hypothetical protein
MLKAKISPSKSDAIEAEISRLEEDLEMRSEIWALTSSKKLIKPTLKVN